MRGESVVPGRGGGIYNKYSSDNILLSFVSHAPAYFKESPCTGFKGSTFVNSVLLTQVIGISLQLQNFMNFNLAAFLRINIWLVMLRFSVCTRQPHCRWLVYSTALVFYLHHHKLWNHTRHSQCAALHGVSACTPLLLGVPTLSHVLAETGNFLVTCPEHNRTLPNVLQGRKDVKRGSKQVITAYWSAYLYF